MIDNENDAAANLEFFKSAILEPALEVWWLLALGERRSTVSAFGVVEATRWLGLGVQIGYFDGNQAQNLLSTEERVLDASYELQEWGLIPPEEKWDDVVRMAEVAQSVISMELFTAGGDIAFATLDLIQRTFQTVLLLTSENILEIDSSHFLDSIGWCGPEEWNARRRGGVRREPGSVQNIGSGFANVLRYWADMDSLSNSAMHRMSSLYDGEWKPGAFVEFEDAWSSQWETTKARVAKFIGETRAIPRPRFNLDLLHVVDQYFVLACEFVNRAREDSPAWLDARLSLFERLIVRIMSAGGGGPMTTKDKTRLWTLFTRGAKNSRVELAFEKGAIENPWETRERSR
jgi:hypothetical protein